jgi:hypothetical protein
MVGFTCLLALVVMTHKVLAEDLYYVVVLAIVLFVCSTFRRRRAYRLPNPRKLPYPLGSKPFPIIGNMFCISAKTNLQRIINLQRSTVGWFLVIFTSSLSKISTRFWCFSVISASAFYKFFRDRPWAFDNLSVTHSDRKESPMSWHDL